MPYFMLSGMSYADAVKTPSPVRTPLEQIHNNTHSLNRNSQVTPEQFKINLDTPKYKLSAKCKESLKKLRQNMEKTESEFKNRRNKPNYMSMTKSSSIRSKLQFNSDDTGTITTARRVPINSKSLLTSGRISKSKSMSSLNRGGWQI
ncbi:hypothetical protein LOTGIDRAFT_170996 [Lottia gigantea]|uniref:Uncharacterized protein n=1 Tax=Lottia gigantea TaxID=225164 RepID=V4AJ31_LOTGI|nr:hypothetical protein LOTGIDRAFT_170996 [Lottia gigantea]ESP04164.1 hypothetical protein LOTGIDRAFT_170996 [Lottia gigantea]